VAVRRHPRRATYYWAARHRGDRHARPGRRSRPPSGTFTDAHGDGPGYLAGSGCDGEDFSIDALRYGSRGAVTTYDLEGIDRHA
jgi:hypothetical protein